MESSSSRIVYEIFQGNVNGISGNINAININWTSANGAIFLTIEQSGLIGICGTRSSVKSVTINTPVPNFNLSSTSGNNLTCTQGTNIQGVPWVGDPITIGGNTLNYSWSANGASIANNWHTGINISHFTTNGPVTVTATARNACGAKSASITLNITQPSVGNVTQNGNPVTNVIPNCQGNFWLDMSNWVSNSAVYTWELPGNYDFQTGEYSKIIRTGKNVSGNLQQGSLVDFNGKVTVTGICGPPQVRNFVVKALQSPTIDNQVISCSNTVVLSALNPNGLSCNWWSENGGTFNATSCQSAIFNAPGMGEYIIHLGTNGPSGCYNDLVTTVKVQGTNAGGTAGWASGVLSDIRERPGSNVAVVGGNVYFAGRDGKLYFYSFNNGTDKWILNTIPGITNAKVPTTGNFTKVATTTEAGVNYLYYMTSGNNLLKVNLSTYVVSNPIVYGSPAIRDFTVNAIGHGFVHKLIDNKITDFIVDITLDPANVVSAPPKVAISATELIYIKNNNLYKIPGATQFTTSGITPGSDVVYFNNYVYYTVGNVGLAQLWRKDINTLAVEQITTSGNLTGVFSINPTTGTLYYGVKNPSNLPTVASGTFPRGEIYQARLVLGVWNFIKTTNGLNYEGSDNFIFGPVFNGNHLFYVGAGGSAATGTQKELEVWNLFYESACTPSVFRKGLATTKEDFSAEPATTTERISVYPNPFDQELNISLGNTTGDISVELYTSTGQLVVSQKLSDGLRISTSQLPYGLYTLIVKQNETVVKREKLAHK